MREARIPSSECHSTGDSEELDLCGYRTSGSPGNAAGNLLLVLGARRSLSVVGDATGRI